MKKISSQISKIFIGLIALAFLILYIFLDIFTSKLIQNQLIDEMKTQIILVNNTLSTFQPETNEFKAEVYKLAGFLQARISVIDRDGKVLEDSEKEVQELENHLQREEIIKAKKSKDNFGTSLRFSDSVKKDLVYVAYKNSSGNFVRIAKTLVFLEKITYEVKLIFLVALVVVLALFIFLAIVTSKSISNPIIFLAETSKKIEQGNYNIEIEYNSNNEIGELAKSLNSMVKNLKAKITALETSEEVRKDFVANASHELKTPLATIKGYTELLIDGALNDKEVNQKFLLRIQSNIDRISEMLEEMLLLSRLEGNNKNFTPRFFDFVEVIKSFILDFQVLAKQKGLEIDFQNLTSQSVKILADKMQIEKVVSNLLSNAVKYTNEGKITVILEKIDSLIVFTVKDTGIGIHKNFLPRIFERFYRIDKGRSRKMGGSGLGLAIVKHIVEKHNGKIEVFSEVGTGTEFKIYIPKS
ncbi:HAMP domain-containing protein [bacterium]|nr:HAMP domain-containing protein [bacterium]